MRAHVKAADEPFVREDVSVAEARERFVGEDQDYKVELIDDLVAATSTCRRVSLYTNGPFTDLCRGPHAPSTKRIKARSSCSRWPAPTGAATRRARCSRASTGRRSSPRQDLAEHLERIEQAKARDHRKLGRELGLFTFSDVSPGAAFWLPAGTQVFNSLVALSREMGRARGYTEVKTPQIYDAELWKTSGHWGKYRGEHVRHRVEDRPMGLKPMNCPGHAHLFATERHSYRDLPVRYSEPGLLHRNEPAGRCTACCGVRHFAQDDAHIFCTEEQIQDEVAACLEFAFATYDLFDFDVRLELSTRPEQRIGTDEMWDRAEDALPARWRARACPTSSTRATARSTGRRSTCT